MNWTHSACRTCWDERMPGREPYRMVEPEPRTCCYCGAPTTSGIYVREDPRTVPFPSPE